MVLYLSFNPSSEPCHKGPSNPHRRKATASPNAPESPPTATLSPAPEEESTELLGVPVADPVELPPAAVEPPVTRAVVEAPVALADPSVPVTTTTDVEDDDDDDPAPDDEAEVVVVSEATLDVVVTAGASGSAERKLGVGVAVPEYSGHPGTPVLGAARPPPQSGTVHISSVSGS